MKKKQKQSVSVLDGETSPQQQSADYVVGQVSGSLFQKNSAASGSSLSALFSSAAPATQLLFQPAPKPVQKSTEVNEEAPEVKGQLETKKKKKPQKEKSEGEERLEDRESGLTNADEEEQGQTAARKKKRTAPENDVEQWVLKRQKMRERKKEEATKKTRTVFVGNLPSGCTKKTLHGLFREKGSIESIRFRSVVREDPSMSRKVAVIQRKVHPKKQSINAYVVFKDEEGATRALERNGMEIQQDFHIRVDRVTGGSEHDHKRSVFVGNLSFEVTEISFRRHFEACGAVEGVRLVRDKNSGLGKGFGYVLFESADSVQLALELDGSKLEGRPVRVKRSVKKEKVKKEKVKKTEGKGTPGRAWKGPPKGPMRGTGRERGGGPGGFKSAKNFSRNQQRAPKSSSSFKGEMTNPIKKTKKKGQKKKGGPNKTVHI
ncbi:RNA-binding protein 34 [Halichoeres trimaculatus]|uniref:RNA-binding protein 34 n=1 Tax=Halichoeres trimaculatus TaxID=147232 RepID=UPI003D9DE5FF